MTDSASKPVTAKTATALDRIPPVDKDIITRGMPFKYLIFAVSDGKSTEMILRCGYSDPWEHRAIVDRVKDDTELSGLRIDTKFGGYLRYDENAKTVRLWGYSARYGRPDLKVVESILIKAFGSDIKIECESGRSIAQEEKDVAAWELIEIAIARGCKR